MVFSKMLKDFICRGRDKCKVLSFATLLINSASVPRHNNDRIHVNTPNLRGLTWGPHGVTQGSLASC